MPETDIQFWLATLDQHGNPALVDGAHGERAGAEEALTLRNRLGMTDPKQVFAIAEVHISLPTGKHGPLNEEAIDTLNRIGLKPQEK